jgi:LPXTG-site transpeptidase (sortase) family protein
MTKLKIEKIKKGIKIMKKFFVLAVVICALVLAQGVFAQNFVIRPSISSSSNSYQMDMFRIGGDSVQKGLPGNFYGPSGSNGATGFSSFCNNCSLPATGFSSRVSVPLSVKPANVNYPSLNLRLQIPSLNVDAEIAGVPTIEDSWAVEWLGDKAGLLSGSYLPGEGLTVIAGHNTLNNTEYGPFALLATMDKNDMIFVTKANGMPQRFSVYANELLRPDDMEKLASIASEVENALVLVTCENEAVEGGYLNRRVIFAKPQ